MVVVRFTYSQIGLLMPSSSTSTPDGNSFPPSVYWMLSLTYFNGGSDWNVRSEADIR
jgi:hypothetical protein